MTYSTFLLFFYLCRMLLPALCGAEENPPRMTLSEGLKLATENSRLIKIASRGRDVSSADVSIAFSRYLPSINASLGQTFLSSPPIAVFGPFAVQEANYSSLSYGFDVQQVLYDFGGRSSRYEAASAAVDTATLNIDRVKNIVALDFISAYFDLLETEKMELVGEKEVERLISHLTMAQSLYKEGVITRNDLLQAEVRLSDAQQRLLTTTNMRAVNVSRINNILSLPLNNPLRAADVAGEPHTRVDLDKAWQLAEKQRIELKTIDRELKINELEKVAKKSEYFPKIFAEGGFNYTENRYLLHDDNWTFMLGLNLNIFNGGSTKAEVAKIDYQREQLLEQRQKLADDIKLDVEKSWLDMKNAAERIRVTRDAIKQGEENLKINKERYREGVGTSTDVLDAITLLTTAETNACRAEYELRRADGAFMYAIGIDMAAEYRNERKMEE
ncbi:MAG TPA: TolC family protein [Dissulfurispiraceae bacterium]|nr:TolC family protein [Dissulfurispiraceae bacterium]